MDDHLNLDPNQQENENNGKEILLQLTRAVAYLHERKIVHRDIKPDNIFIGQDHLNKPPQIKLADFGKSILLNNIDSSFENITDIKGDPQLGTVGWQAPEIHRSGQKECDFKIDIFSLGLVFVYTLTKRRHPFDSEGEECPSDYVIQININKLNDEANNIMCETYLNCCRALLGKEASELIITNMVRSQPIFRFTSRQVLDDDFFQT